MLLPQKFSDVTLIGTACPRHTLIQQQANPLIWANLQIDKDKKSMKGSKASLNPLKLFLFIHSLLHVRTVTIVWTLKLFPFLKLVSVPRF